MWNEYVYEKRVEAKRVLPNYDRKAQALTLCLLGNHHDMLYVIRVPS